MPLLSVRGRIAGTYSITLGTGLVLAYIVGFSTNYIILNSFNFGCAVVYLLLLLWLPESPIYLLQNGKQKEALQALLKLRGYNQRVADKEFTTLSARVKEIQVNSNKAMTLYDFLSNRATRRGFFIVICTWTLQQCSGISPILMYTPSILVSSGNTLPASLSTVCVGVLQLVGNIISVFLVDRIGRRPLLMIACVGTTLALAPLSCYFYFELVNTDIASLHSYGWVPVASLSLFNVFYSIGLGPGPMILLSEMFYPEANRIASTLCLCYIFIIIFLFTKCFPSLSHTIGKEMCFMIFNGFCAFSILYTYFFVIETKNRPIEDINEELEGRSKNLNDEVIESKAVSTDNGESSNKY